MVELLATFKNYFLSSVNYFFRTESKQENKICFDMNKNIKFLHRQAALPKDGAYPHDVAVVENVV